MDANEGGDGFGDGVGDPSEQFHRNEAISAVADEGFLGEEDDDYEDLYNDVNVGENFLQSLRKNEDLGFRNEEVVEKLPPKPTTVAPPAQTPSAVGGERKAEKEEDGGTKSSGRLEGYQSMGFRGNEMGARTSTVVAGGSGTPGGELRVELGHSSGKVATDLEEQAVSGNAQNQSVAQQPLAAPVGNLVNVGNAGNDSMARQGGGNMSGNISGGGAFAVGGGGGPGGGTVLFVGDLHWWTTDAELETELSKYGPVKEVKFFDEKASGKSKGYCQVEYFDPSAATACKEGMNGHVFNGRPCVVAFASPYTVKKMGEAQLNRNQQMTQTSAPQARRGPGDAIGKPTGNNIATGGNYQGGGDNNRGYGRGNWGGRGGAQGMGNRGPLGPMRSRPGGMGGRGLMGNGGNAFGQGIGGTPPMLHPQAMMGPGFDPAFGGPMGRMGSYGGYPGAPTPPFSGILPSFPPVGSVGLPGVAPHVNPAFFGRGMPMNGMGMMPGAGVEGPNMGMWSDMNMGGGWTGEEHGGRAGESSYNEEAVSDHQHGEVSHDRGAWPGGLKEKDRGVERDWSGSTDRRHRDDKEPGFDREMPREKDIGGHDHDWSERKHRDNRDIGRERERERERERSRDRDRDRDRDVDRDRDRDRGHERERDHHRDERYAAHHRHRDHEPEYNDDWDRGRSSRTHAKSRVSREEEQRSRSRDAEYGKRRRMTSE